MNPALSGFFFVKIGHLSFLKNREVNILRTATQLSQDDPNVFNVFWMAGLERKGTVQVMTPPYLSGRYIAAELSAIKWLLEQANVCGHDKTGAGLHLYLSSQDTLDLVQKTSQSSHIVPYVNFLHTRFYGCEVSLDEDRTWATAGCEKEVSAINATPIRTSISVQGVRWPDCTWQKARRRFYWYMEKLNLTLKGLGVTAHGLRHGYIHGRYEAETGFPPPIKGGALGKIDRATHEMASMTISSEAGHGRPDVAPSYYGSYGHQLRNATVKMSFGGMSLPA